MDPLNVIARSHDLALHARVLDYRPEELEGVMYGDRALFDYGALLRIYPMEELPHWRVSMRRRASEERIAELLRRNRATVRAITARMRADGPISHRDLDGASLAVDGGRKQTAQVLYMMWLTGRLMVHHRRRFERVYHLREATAPASFHGTSTAREADRFFARKTLAWRGLSTAENWSLWFGRFTQRRLTRDEARRSLDRMVRSGEAALVGIEGEREPHYLTADALPILESLEAGRVPPAWASDASPTETEVRFLAPLEVVTAAGRAGRVFGFDYVWEVYKPAGERKWGYYVLPILYQDRLVGRIEPRLDRSASTLVVRQIWLEEPGLGRDERFLVALTAGLRRLQAWVRAGRVDVTTVATPDLRRRLRAALE